MIILYSFSVAIIVTFFICWTPYHVQKLVFVFFSMKNSWTQDSISLYQITHHIAGGLFYINAALNPFLYSLCSQRFRTESWNLFQKFASSLHFCKRSPNTSSEPVETAPILDQNEDILVVEYRVKNGESQTEDTGVISIVTRKSAYASIHI